MTDLTQRIDDRVLAVDERLGEVIAQRRALAREHSASYGELWGAVARMAAGGKKIRPLLLLDAYDALGGADGRAAMDAACAVELLHMTLVIHDDLIDGDETRRGEPNIAGLFSSEARLRGASRRSATTWGEASALLAGDMLLSLAHSLLSRLEVEDERRRAVLDVFDGAVFESAAGEHDDVRLSMHLERATSADVLAMIERKTAAYSFAAPLVIAAVLAGAATSVTAELTSIARHLGVIYQLRDDVLGLFGDERETGKSTLSDLREGKETLLIACARSDQAWPGVAPLLGDPALDTAGARRLTRVIEESGARLFVESVIADRCVGARDLILRAELPDRLRRRLADLVSSCSLRTS